MIFWLGSFCIVANKHFIFWQRNPFCEDKHEGKPHEINFPWTPQQMRKP